MSGVVVYADRPGPTYEKVVRISLFEGPWGPIWIASTDVGICAVKLRGGRQALKASVMERFANAYIVEDHDANCEAVEQLKRYFEGAKREFDLTVHLRGSPFQMMVWRALVEIPYGNTRSYGEIALGLGRPKAARAVGQANGSNPVPIVVPCHRVICSDGSLGGFGSGEDIKRDLLDLENTGRRLRMNSFEGGEAMG